MKVYGHPMSTCTQKVLTTLHEKGHEAEFVLVDLMKGEHKQPAYLARHPFGVVPVLDDDGYEVYESRAIIRYLDRKLSGPSLTPGEPQDLGRMEQWMSVEQSYFTPAAMKIVRQRVFAPMMGKEPDQKIIDEGMTDAGKVLDVVAQTLSRQEYLAPSGFSLADICWMPYVQYLFKAQAGSLITDRPAVAAWWERVSSRASWKKITG